MNIKNMVENIKLIIRQWVEFDILDEIKNKINEFYEIEYGEQEKGVEKIDLINNYLIPIAYTEDFMDSEDEYSYYIQCYLDLKNKKDIYEMGNGILKFISCKDTTYDDMLLNLNAEYNDWISFVNCIDYDDASEITEKYLQKADIAEEINELKLKNITVEFI